MGLSMKRLISTNKGQSGVGLLEALIAIMLSSIVILGAAFSISRILVSQKQSNLQYIVINELRNKLQTATVEQRNQWCKVVPPIVPTITLPKETEVINIKVTCESTDVTIINSSNPTYNKTIKDEMQPLTFEIDSPSLGGKVTVGEGLK